MKKLICYIGILIFCLDSFAGTRVVRGRRGKSSGKKIYEVSGSGREGGDGIFCEKQGSKYPEAGYYFLDYVVSNEPFEYFRAVPNTQLATTSTLEKLARITKMHQPYLHLNILEFLKNGLDSKRWVPALHSEPGEMFNVEDEYADPLRIPENCKKEDQIKLVQMVIYNSRIGSFIFDQEMMREQRRQIPTLVELQLFMTFVHEFARTVIPGDSVAVFRLTEFLSSRKFMEMEDSEALAHLIAMDLPNNLFPHEPMDFTSFLAEGKIKKILSAFPFQKELGARYDQIIADHKVFMVQLEAAYLELGRRIPWRTHQKILDVISEETGESYTDLTAVLGFYDMNLDRAVNQVCQKGQRLAYSQSALMLGRSDVNRINENHWGYVLTDLQAYHTSSRGFAGFDTLSAQMHWMTTLVEENETSFKQSSCALFMKYRARGLPEELKNAVYEETGIQLP